MGGNFGKTLATFMATGAVVLGAPGATAADVADATVPATAAPNPAYTQKLENCVVGAVRLNAPDGASTRVRDFNGEKIVQAEQDFLQSTGQSLLVEIGKLSLKIAARDDGPRGVDTTATNSYAYVVIKDVQNLSDAKMVVNGGLSVKPASLTAREISAKRVLNEIRSCMRLAPN